MARKMQTMARGSLPLALFGLLASTGMFKSDLFARSLLDLLTEYGWYLPTGCTNICSARRLGFSTVRGWEVLRRVVRRRGTLCTSLPHFSLSSQHCVFSLWSTAAAPPGLLGATIVYTPNAWQKRPIVMFKAYVHILHVDRAHCGGSVEIRQPWRDLRNIQGKNLPHSATSRFLAFHPCDIDDMRYALSRVACGYQWEEVGKGWSSEADWQAHWAHWHKHTGQTHHFHK